MNLRPLHDGVLIRRIDNEKKSGSIIIPTNAQQKQLEGVVVAVGNGRVTEDGEVVKPQVKEGDRVIFKKYAENEIEIDGVSLLILNESGILAVLDD